MHESDSRSPLARRSFLSRIGSGAAAFGAAFATGDVAAGAQVPAPAAAGPFSAARHGEDDWFDQTTAKHRFFMDTTSVSGFANAVFYANNFYTASRSGYSLADADSSIVICARHASTPFAFTDAMWANYGFALAEHADFTDPKTKEVPVINVFRAAGYTMLPNRGVTLDVSLNRGLRLAVCQLATRAISGIASRKTGTTVDEVFKELTSNLVPNAHMVPAGIVAVSRAQERGFTFSYVA